jgi:pimeloyl-ACP methyl ester carboxylesterase
MIRSIARVHPLPTPWRTSSPGCDFMKEMMREVADNVTALRITKAAHWIAEENPAEFVTELLGFLGPA